MPGDLHHTGLSARGKYHVKVQSDQKCQGEIYLQLLGGCFDLHSSSSDVLLRFLSNLVTGGTVVSGPGLLFINW